MNNSKMIAVFIVLLVIVGGGAYYLGTKSANSQRNGQFSNQFGGGQGGGRNGGNGLFQRAGQGARAVRGQVISSDDKSITVKQADGSSRIVLFSGSTSIIKAATGSASDLKNGEEVMVFGSTNSDGSMTAQNIEVNPPMRKPSPAQQ